MKLRDKLFLGIGVILFLSLCVVLYTDSVRARILYEAEVKANAKTLQNMMASMRQVYIQQFRASGIPITDNTIGFLPAHAMSRIADNFAKRTQSGITFNNVSDRPRNPKNQADVVELSAIRYFREYPYAKDRLVTFSNPESDLNFHFSAPIWIEKSCLTCHGDRSTAPAAVKNRYENAWNYKEGELRGILSIKMPGAGLASRIESYQKDTLMLFGLMFVLIFLLLNGTLHRLVLSRVERLKSATRALQTGQQLVLEENTGNDEISVLAENFNQMAREVSRRELELRENTSLQKAVFSSAQDAIVMADESGHILMFNPVACQLFGYQESEVINQPLSMLIPLEFRNAHEQGFSHYLEHGDAKIIGKPAIEIEGLHCDGSIFPIEMSLGEGLGSGKRVFVAAIRDISERIKAQNDLQLAATAFEGLSPMLVTDAKGDILRINTAFSDVTGYLLDEVQGRNPRMLQSGRQDFDFYQNLWGVLKSTGEWQGEIWNKRKNGEIYPEWLNIKAVFNTDKEVIHYVGSFTDLTQIEEQRQIIEKHAIEEKVLGELLRQALSPTSLEHYLEESLDSLFEGIPWLTQINRGGIFLVDENHNDVLNLVADKKMDEPVIESCSEVIFGKCPCGRAASEQSVQFSSSISKQQSCKVANKIDQPYAQFSLPILEDGNLLGVMVLYVSVDHQSKDSELGFLKRVTDVLAMGISRLKTSFEIEHQAYHDALTGLPNRRMLKDILKQELSLAKRRKLSGALLFIDLDQFKHLNDSLGHSVGDELLIEVSRRLKSDLRDCDTVARLGGDEFVVLLPALGKKVESVSRKTHKVAEKLRLHLAQTYQLSGYQHHVTASIGIALLPADVSSVDDILKHADAAMYVSKSKGRNRVSFYQSHLQEAADERLFLETELRQAIDRDELQLYFQPQVDHIGQPIGAEALLRWNHHQRGFISPADFIPVAEESGMILDIGDWVCNTACQHLSNWQQDGISHELKRIAINVSPHQFHQIDFVERIMATAKLHKVDPGKLELELTEGIVLEDVELVITRMQLLKDAGFSISMDDFGTGYSSLNYLKRLPMNVLKIDQSFIHDVNLDPRDAAVVETIISMANFLGLQVIAEGVETIEELDYLKIRGCPHYQGYYFSKPLSAIDFGLWMKKKVTAKRLVTV